jgi:hypothetical protein
MRRYLPHALVALLVFSAGWWARQPAPPAVRYRDVIVPETVLVAGEPQVEVRWRTRIVTRVVRPEQTATAPDAGEPDVASFCAEYVRGLQPDTVRDTIRVPDRRLLIRSGRYDGRELTVWGPTSSGDLKRIDYRARAPLSWVVDGDSVVVRSARAWWIDDAIRAGVYVGAGYLLGALTQ